MWDFKTKNHFTQKAVQLGVLMLACWLAAVGCSGWLVLLCWCFRVSLCWRGSALVKLGVVLHGAPKTSRVARVRGVHVKIRGFFAFLGAHWHKFVSGRAGFRISVVVSFFEMSPNRHKPQKQNSMHSFGLLLSVFPRSILCWRVRTNLPQTWRELQKTVRQD